MLLCGGFGLALSIGPQRPAPLAVVENAKFQILPTLLDLPAISRLDVRYDSPIAYRAYPGTPHHGVAIVLHGSSALSLVMHPLALRLNAAGVSVYVPDIRGHGDTAPKGDLRYRGELEDDFTALLTEARSAHPGERIIVIGHSMGGSLALRLASEPVGRGIDGFLALAPFIAADFPGIRPNSGWADVALSRAIAIWLLDRVGLDAFDHLPVIGFAVPKGDIAGRTAFYSFRLLENFVFPIIWKARLAAIDRPARVMIGANDEVFLAADYPAAFARFAPRIPVEIIGGEGHIGLILDPPAIARIVRAAQAMLAPA